MKSWEGCNGRESGTSQEHPPTLTASSLQFPNPSPSLSGERWEGRWGQPGLQEKCLPSLVPPALPLGLVACMREVPPVCGVGGKSGGG